jgi:hypothetical protein
MELSKHNNFEVLDAMLAISEITGLDFERVCRTNLTTWWGTLLDQMVQNGECPEPFNNIFDRGNGEQSTKAHWLLNQNKVCIITQ